MRMILEVVVFVLVGVLLVGAQQEMAEEELVDEGRMAEGEGVGSVGGCIACDGESGGRTVEEDGGW